MSSPVAYDPDLFVVERTAVYASGLDQFILDLSELDTGGSFTAYATVLDHAATVTVTKAYQISDNSARTLLLDTDTAEISMSWWRLLEDIDVASIPLAITDSVRVTYDGHEILSGTVDATQVQYSSNPQAPIGANHQVDFSAHIVGAALVPLSTTVSWSSLPAEGARDRIERWFVIDGTSDNNPMDALPDPGQDTLLNLLRIFSSVDAVSLRLTGTSAEIVDLVTLPTGFSQDDAEDMYYQTKRSAQAGQVAISLDEGDLLVAADAALVTNDVRLVVSDWQIPSPLPVYTLAPAPVKRVTYAFTPNAFTGSVEFHVPIEDL